MTDFTSLKWTHGQSDWDAQFNAAMDLATSATGALEAFQASVGATSTSAQAIPAIGGAMSFTITEAGRAFVVGATYQVSRVTSPGTIVIGTVASWTSASKSLTLTVTQSVAATGPFSDWLITPVLPGALPAQAGNANGMAVTNGSAVSWQPLSQIKTRSGSALVGVASATISAAGTGYAPGNSITLTGGTATAQAVLSVVTTQLAGLTVSGGASYAVNDVITLAATGGTMTTPPTLKVTAVSAGAITGFSLVSTGAFTGNPTGFTQAATTGSGSGASFSAPVYGVGTVTPLAVGAYTAAPSNPVGQGATSGSGVGATFMIATGTAYTLVAGGGANGDLSATQDFTGGGVLTVPAMSGLQLNYTAYVYASGAAVTLYVTGTDTLNGASNPITVAKGNLAEIVVTSAGSPGNARVIQTAGPVTLPNSGAANTITASTTLTAVSAQLQRVVMASTGQTVTLPDATALQKGAAPFVIKADGNSLGFSVRDNAGSLIAYQSSGDTVSYGLVDNSVAAGVWVPITAQSGQPALVNSPTVYSSTAANSLRSCLEPLTATTALLIYYTGASTTAYSSVVTMNAATGALSFSAPQTITLSQSVPAMSLKAFTATSGVLGNGGNQVMGWTLSGSTLTLGAAITLNAATLPNDNPPQFDMLYGSTTQCLCVYTAFPSNYQTGVVVLTLSGATVSQGSSTFAPLPNYSSRTYTGPSPQVAVLSATKAVVLSTQDSTGAYLSNMAINTVTLTGTTINSVANPSNSTVAIAGSATAANAGMIKVAAATATTAIVAYVPFLSSSATIGPLTLVAYSVVTNSIVSHLLTSLFGPKYVSSLSTITALKRAPNGRFYLFAASLEEQGFWDFYLFAFYYDDTSSLFTPGNRLHMATLLNAYPDTAVCFNLGSNTALIAYGDGTNNGYGTAARVELAA